MLRIQNGPLSLAVDAATGGRITEFSHHEKNSLFTGKPAWGSTFGRAPNPLGAGRHRLC